MLTRTCLLLCLISLSSCFQGRRTAATAGITRYYIDYKGNERTFLVYEPSGFSQHTPLPVLFCLHGGGGSDQGMIRLTRGRFNALADEHGFLVVYPQGLEKGWNDGREGAHSAAAREKTDDVGFFRLLIRELKKKYELDPEGLYACGISNGGFMSNRLACELSGLLAGIAVVTATGGTGFMQGCLPARTIKVLVINGTEDPLVPFGGGTVKVLRQERGEIVSTTEMMKLWSDRNACIPQAVTDTLPDADPGDGTRVVRHSFPDSSGTVPLMLLEIIGGGHTWPGGRQYMDERLIGRTSRDIDACDEIWNFLSR